MSRSWKGGATRAYRKLRAAILLANARENKGRCTLRIEGVCTGQADQVHHVKGKRYGDDPRWMVATCKACNLHVGDPSRISPEHKRVSRW